jgi:hypothetical protein
MGFYPFGPVGQVEDPWLPADNGMQVAVSDPFMLLQSSLPVAGTLYLTALQCRAAATLSSLWWAVNTAGVGASAGSFTGLYSSAGVLLAQSADIGASLLAAGSHQFPLSGPVTLPAGSLVWAALLTNLATTQPAMSRNNGFANVVNLGLTPATARFATNGAGLAALPASIIPANNVLSALSFWAGAS